MREERRGKERSYECSRWRGTQGDGYKLMQYKELSFGVTRVGLHTKDVDMCCRGASPVRLLTLGAHAQRGLL